MKRKCSAALAILAALSGCGGDGGDDTSVATDPRSACSALGVAKVDVSSIGLPTKGASISSAKLVPQSSTTPEYCEVVGEIASVDPKAFPIRFTAGFPSAWNNRLMQLGGGGWGGSMWPVTGAGSAFTSAPSPLSRGYVVFSTDMGHPAVQVPGVNEAAFTLIDEQLQNFAGDALKKTRDSMVQLIRSRYGSEPVKTYFMGGSEGGRESMKVIERWPQDYDGVFTLFPVFNWTGVFLKWNAVGTAMRANGGAGWLNPAKAQLIRDAQTQACDTLDGLADGLISNVQACTFDTATLRCPNGADAGDTCLSNAQVETARVMFSRLNLPYSLAHDVTSVPPYFPGTFFKAASVGSSAKVDLQAVLSGSALANLGTVHGLGDSFVRFLILKEPQADVLTFDARNPGPYLDRIQQASRLLDATNTDINRFIARGGKWIMAHGLADELPHASATNEHYERLVQRYGKTELDKTLRYYTIPGFAHVGGQFAAEGGMPALDALEAWVERNQAPEELVVTDTNAGQAPRSRPLCVYPAWPQYQGTGDPAQASSFKCVR